MAHVGGVSGEQLRSILERIERLEEEKANLLQDIREVYGEAKANGYDVKVLRQLVKIRKIDRDELSEQEAVLDLYKQAVGMIPASSEAA